MEPNRIQTQIVAPSSNAQSTRRLRSRQGVLETMMYLPLDILFEILNNLVPLDLLHLTRATKGFRATLLNRNSTTVWRRCRNNVCGIPECPDGLSEPQYAHLLLEPLCHICGIYKPNTVLWLSLLARVRFCNKCSESVSVVPDFPEKFLEKLLPLTATALKLPAPGPYWSNFKTIPFIPHLRQMYEEYKNLQEHEAQERWLSDKTAVHKAAQQHLEKCLEYYNEVGRRRRGELQLMSEHRKSDIVEELIELGWEEELFEENAIRKLSSLREVKVPEELTDTAWEAVRPTLEAFLTHHRESRLRRERRELIYQRCSVLKEAHRQYYRRYSLKDFVYNVGDFLYIGEILGLLLGTPAEIEVTLKDVDFILGGNRLNRHMKAWLDMTTRDLLDVLQRSSLGPAGDSSILNCVTTLFRCANCPMPIGYPQILVHVCSPRSVVEYDESQDLKDVFDILGCRSWDHSSPRTRITFDESAHQAAKAILTTMGIDGTKLSYEPIKFNTWNVFVEYLPLYPSPNSTENRTVMRWTEALYFNRHLDENHEPFCWGRLSTKDQLRAIKAERALVAKCKRKDFPPTVRIKWKRYQSLCGRCGALTERLLEMKTHLHDDHNIRGPIIGLDYYLHMDAVESYESCGAVKIK